MNRDQFIVKSYYDRVTPAVEVAIDGSGGELISWRNIAGHPCVSMAYSQSILPASGIYNVVFQSSTTALVYSAYSFNPISPSIDTTEVSIISGEVNFCIIPGLEIILGNNITVDDKFQVIVGGFWSDDEQRVIKSLIFNPITSGTMPSSENTIKVINNSGKDLRNVKATVLNSLFVKQYQNMIDFNTAVDNREVVQWSPSVDDLPEEMIVRLTSASTPRPCKVVASHDTTAIYYQWDIPYEYSNCYYPFSNLGGTTPSEFGFCRGWNLPLDSSLWETGISGSERSIAEGVEIYLRYDFGKNNAVCFNRLGIGYDNMPSFTLEASNDNVEEPTNWTVMSLIGYSGARINSHCYVEGSLYPMLVRYYNFTNFIPYRHWRVCPASMWTNANWYDPTDRRPRIARLEFINIPDTIESPDRDRPFEVIDKVNDENPVFVNNDTPYVIQISKDYLATEVDITIDGVGYDIWGLDAGITYFGGIGVPFSTYESLQFSDLSPLSGLVFILNEDIEDGDYCFAYVSEGRASFQIKSHTGPIWDSDVALTGSVALEDGIMEVADHMYLDVRLNPGKGVTGSTSNPVEGILFIQGETDNEYDDTLQAKAYDLNEDVPLSGTIRQQIKNLDFTGDEIRFEFQAFSDLEISEAYFGLSDASGYDFQIVPEKIPVTFDGSTSLSIIGAGTQWTDWIKFPTNGDDTFLTSYHGTAIGSKPTVDSGETSCFIDGNYIAGFNVVSGYIEYDTNFDIVNIEIRNRTKVCKAIGLTSMIAKGINNVEVNVTMIPSEISTVLEDFGIGWEEIS